MGQALLVRRPAPLSAAPLGPAQPPERGGAEPGGAAAGPQHFGPNRQCLAWIEQVIHTSVDVVDTDTGNM